MKHTTHHRFARVSGLALCLLIAGAASFACGDEDTSGGPDGKNDGGIDPIGQNGDTGVPTTRPTKLSRASHGSALDIAEDDDLLVAVNRDVGTVTVFEIAGTVLTKKAEIAVCAEPYQVALAPSGDRGFVVCRKDQKLVRIDALRTAPVKGPEVA